MLDRTAVKTEAHEGQGMMQAHHITIRPDRSVPGEVPAGTDVDLKLQLSCTAGCDLRGSRVEIRDPDGASRMSAVGHDQAVSETEVFTLHVPQQVGVYRWTVVYSGDEAERSVHGECVYDTVIVAT